MTTFQITDLTHTDHDYIQQAAELLVEGFREHWPNAWPTLDSALVETRDMLAEDRICRVAIGPDDVVLGWIGGIPNYGGNVWELHPLVVRGDMRLHGIGRALVLDLEERVRERGGLTITVGTDDEDGMTSLAYTDLYPNILDHLQKIRDIKRHPFGFYLKLGFSISGVIPDANGLGKPDILMAKRVGEPVSV